MFYIDSDFIMYQISDRLDLNQWDRKNPNDKRTIYKKLINVNWKNTISKNLNQKYPSENTVDYYEYKINL